MKMKIVQLLTCFFTLSYCDLGGDPVLFATIIFNSYGAWREDQVAIRP